VVLNARDGGRIDAASSAAGAVSPTLPDVVWHELECGGYRADLELWRELAVACDGPILDVGAGSGRVTLALARDGHAVTAVDREQALVNALAQRAHGLDVDAVCADARSLELSRRDFALCLMPMQTIQLLDGEAGRLAFLRRARAHVRPGGLIACAILGELEPFDCSDGREGPAPEHLEVDGIHYLSQALRVGELPAHVVIERERRTVSDRVERSRERNLIELDRLSAATLEREGMQVGLRVEPSRQIAATSEHIGSVVVVLRA
jgi:SAM-dependent methyltransferase